MARKKIKEEAKGFPLWQSTFSDLMNLLLCFFVLLFAMSSPDTEKYDMVTQSFQQSFTIFPAGGTSVNVSGGHLISSGVSVLKQFDGYFQGSTSEKGEQENKGNNADSKKKNIGTEGQKAGDKQGRSTGKDGDIKDSVNKDSKSIEKMSDKELKKKLEAVGEKESEKISEQIEKEIEKKNLGNADSKKKNIGTEGQKAGDKQGRSTGKDGDIKDSVNKDSKSIEKMSDKELKKKLEAVGEKESEKISEQIEKEIEKKNLGNVVDVDFNGQYVEITMNGALLFNPGKAKLKAEAEPVLEKLSEILQRYADHDIEVQGHTDNVPQKSRRFENNDVLSMYRALYVADYIRGHTKIDPAKIYSSGRGEYDPIADNSTPEGRAMNRRVTIKIYNSYNSK